MINFNDVENYFWERIDKGMHLVIATSANNKVTARTVTVIPYNKKLYFPTWNNTIKYSQIKENNNVALSVDAIQLTGTAVDVGHPKEEKNKEFSRIFRDTFPDGFDEFITSNEAIVVEITLDDVMFNQVGSGEMYKASLTEKTFVDLGYTE